MGRQLTDYEQEFRALGEEAFRLRYTFPILVWLDKDEDEEPVTFETGFSAPTAIARPVSEDELSGASLAFDPERSDELRFARPNTGNIDLGKQQTFSVKKRAGAPLQERIGVGRTPNVDVCIPLPRISKYHAYFKWSEDEKELSLSDAKSKNGTRVRGHQLPPETPMPVYDSDEIRFGPYRFKIIFGSSFSDLVARRCGA